MGLFCFARAPFFAGYDDKSLIMLVCYSKESIEVVAIFGSSTLDLRFMYMGSKHTQNAQPQWEVF